MTEMELKLQELAETTRANKAQEALKEKDLLAVGSLREAQALQAKSNAAKLDEEAKYIRAEYPKLEAEIAKILADTRLSEMQRVESISKQVKNYTSGFKDVIGGIKDVVGMVTGAGGSATALAAMPALGL